MNKSFTDEYWMEIALNYAKKAYDLGEVPVGAVVVLDNNIIGVGHNNPIMNSDPTGHAEINAIRNASSQVKNYRLVGSTLYVTLEPCTMCFGAMVHARITRLVYAAREGKSGVIVSNLPLDSCVNYNHKINVVGGILEKKSSDLLKQFFLERRQSKKRIK